MINYILVRVVINSARENLRSDALFRPGRFLGLAVTVLALGCAQPLVTPNLDHLVGKKFSEVVFMGRNVFKKASETAISEELFERTGNGCVLFFGVGKHDDVILYWRIEPSAESCKSRARPLNM